MQPDLHSRTLTAHTLHQFRNLSPLTHCMTNEVMQSFIANTLLALGASPAVVIKPEETSQFTAIANALLVSVGTLTRERAAVTRVVIKQAHHAKTPWAFGPVAVGMLGFRRRFCLKLLSLQPAAIHGNVSEILVPADMNDGGHGVNITDTAIAAFPAVQALARQIGTIVMVTDEMDYVTDDQRTVCVDGGDPLMTCVVGAGCALSAVVVASCTLHGDRLDSVASACSRMKQAGQIATGQSNGPGSFVPAFLDALYNLNAQEQA